jgi:hypothetical protein
VLAMILFDKIHWRSGYLCSRCRVRWFLKYEALTLVLGWWGLIAVLIRNPYTIVKNVKALFRTPLFPDSAGAVKIDEFRKYKD